jgi:hypothetical protein
MNLAAKLSGIYHFTKTKNSLRNLTFKNNWIAGGIRTTDFCLSEIAQQNENSCLRQVDVKI